MALRSTSFAVGEWYHCYSRGVDKRKTFQSAADYQRFLQLLYACNSAQAIHLSNLWRHADQYVWEVERPEPLVGIAAYALMPNHFHLFLYEKNQGGITKFMQKLGTSYAMYFNKKNERVGNVFVKPFKAKHVGNESYFRHIPHYIHLNPAELFEPEWKNGEVKNLHILERRLKEYPYSSLADYYQDGTARIQKKILDTEMLAVLNEPISLPELLVDAQQYYKGL